MKLKCKERVNYRWNTNSMYSHDMNIEDIDVRHHENKTISQMPHRKDMSSETFLKTSIDLDWEGDSRD